MAQFERVAADVPYAAAFEGDLSRGGCCDRRPDVHLGLLIRLPARRQSPVSVGKREPLEPDLFNESFGGHVATQFNQPVEHRSHDRHGLGRLARQRAVGECAGRPVEIPRAGRTERFANILRTESVALGKGAPFLNAPGASRERDSLLWRVILHWVDRGDRQAGHRPLMDGDHLHVAEIRPVSPQFVA